MGPLKVKFSGLFCSHTSNSSYCHDLDPINLVRSSFTVFCNDFTKILSYLMKLKEIEQTKLYQKL